MKDKVRKEESKAYIEVRLYSGHLIKVVQSMLEQLEW